MKKELKRYYLNDFYKQNIEIDDDKIEFDLISKEKLEKLNITQLRCKIKELNKELREWREDYNLVCNMEDYKYDPIYITVSCLELDVYIYNKELDSRYNMGELVMKKLKNNLRVAIYYALKNKGYTKRNKTYNIIGCEFEEFLTHLNNNPYGFKYGDIDLDLDHIIPLASVNTEEEILKLNHYTNFQLLPSEYNRNIKRANIWDKEDFEQWLMNF